ncbi:MAG: PEP-CTERM sorting domain-containing protein [Opitutae bacterium]|nr:PEP-CTERM sorting domain-containing protein [Opitutae bacterium]MDG1300479.1 PEP-CTERM sorting domain-containing protein [Opitutae bacterium]
MKKITLILGAAAIAVSSLSAASGIFGTGVVISNNGTSTLYESTLLGDARHAPNGFTPTLNTVGFNGFNLGTFDTTTSDSLVLNGGSVLTYKNDTDNISGASVFYSINGAAFTEITLGFNEDNVNGSGGDQRWYSEESSVDLLSGLSSGNHTIAVMYEAPFTYTGGGGGSGTHAENNGDSNFTANFTVVPEPGTCALIAGLFGMTFVALRRRQRN